MATASVWSEAGRCKDLLLIFPLGVASQRCWKNTIGLRPHWVSQALGHATWACLLVSSEQLLYWPGRASLCNAHDTFFSTSLGHLHCTCLWLFCTETEDAGFQGLPWSQGEDPWSSGLFPLSCWGLSLGLPSPSTWRISFGRSHGAGSTWLWPS